jgi:hypothetical protein
LSCFLEDEDGRSTMWVVKLPEPRRPMAVIAEALGSLLVELAEIRTPAAGALSLPLEPLRLSQEDASLRLDEAIQQHPGASAFCSEFIPNAVEHTEGMESRRQPKQLLALFVVDAFMWHFDRTRKTPNILWDERDMIAIDHGRALFEFEAIAESGASLRDGAEHYSDNWSEHVFFKYLRRQFHLGCLRRADISTTTALLCKCLTGQFNADMVAWLELLSATRHQEEVTCFLAQRVAAVDSLTEEIANVLASS